MLKGGLKMFDINNFIAALKYTWKKITNRNKPWTVFFFISIFFNPWRRFLTQIFEFLRYFLNSKYFENLKLFLSRGHALLKLETMQMSRRRTSLLFQYGTILK